MMTETIPTAIKGLANEFAESDQPREFARVLTNRFINIQGAAEKRPGITRIPSPIDNGFTGNFDCVTEHVARDGSVSLLASRIASDHASRDLIRYSTTAASWVQVSGKLYTQNEATLSEKAYAVQHSDKSIFVAQDIRPAYYVAETDAIYPLQSVIETGKTTSGTTSTVVKDSSVGDWLNETLVRTNDLFYNASKNAFGVVTSVGVGNIDVTAITSAGGGGTGLGLASGSMGAGDAYEIWDLVALNIVPISQNIQEKDNVAILGPGTTTSAMAVSALPLNSTDLRPYDYVYNPTRAAVTRVINVSANAQVVPISGQTTGDSAIFLKSAVPIASFAHVHYGRTYLVDARQPTNIIVSNDGDPTDYTTYQLTLEASQINYGGYQPQGEKILTLATFQKFLVAGGQRNVYVTQGTNPIADTTAQAVDLTPVGLFSQGCVSRRSLVNIGSNLIFVAQDGPREFRLTDILAVDTTNIAEVIKTDLRTALRDEMDDNQIQAVHYPQRNWVMLKVGDSIYNFNYTPTYTNNGLQGGGSWSFFEGKFAECDNFYVRNDGTMLCTLYDASASATYFYEFDTGGYTDDGDPIVTDYETPWIDFGDKDGSIVKDGRYIRPYFENSSNQNYTITATSDLEEPLLCDTLLVSAAGGSYIGNAIVGVSPVGGSDAINEGKFPLRWRGKQVKVRITTSAGTGSDTISKFILYGNTFGRA